LASRTTKAGHSERILISGGRSRDDTTFAPRSHLWSLLRLGNELTSTLRQHPAAAAAEIADVMRDIKTCSSKMLNEQRLIPGPFHWQTGYAIFSVSQSARSDVAEYVRNQETHHAKKTFEEEYLLFLKRHGIDHDPRFVFDTEFAA
jgi:putative transposase